MRVNGVEITVVDLTDPNAQEISVNSPKIREMEGDLGPVQASIKMADFRDLSDNSAIVDLADLTIDTMRLIQILHAENGWIWRRGRN